MIKKYLFFFPILVPYFLFSQTGNLKIQTGVELRINGAVQLVLTNMDFTNCGAFVADSSELIFTGNESTTITSGGSAINDLQIAKSNAQHVQLKDDLQVYGTLQFSGMENLLEVDSSQLILEATADISGADRHNFVLTDSTGSVLKKDLTSFTFPIGAGVGFYNPLSVEQTGTTNHISARCLPAALAEGDQGAPFTENVVTTTWDIREQIPGGSLLNLTAQWEKKQELLGFDRDDCGLAQYQGNSLWDLSPSHLSAASGTNPFTQSIAQVEPGIFILSSDSLMNKVLLDLQVYLQGPYNGSTMNDQIRNAGNLPTSSPYGTGKFANAGRGGGEVATASAFDANGDDSVVDWVFIWLKDANDPSLTLQTTAALLQKDGDIVALDGVSPLTMPGDSGTYHLGIGHRNHLSIRTATAQSLTESTPLVYDFSSGASQAYGTDPMAEQSGVFLLWGGNTNENTSIRATGPPVINDYSTILSFLGSSTNVLFNQYTSKDVNMDGTVRLTGPPTINDYSKLLNILGTPTSIINEQF